MPPSVPDQLLRQDVAERPLASADQTLDSADTESADAKSKRRLLGLGRKSEADGGMSTQNMSEAAVLPQTQSAINAMRPNPITQQYADLKPQPMPVSPSRHPYQGVMAASPSRLRSSSPRLHSPASSEIFERDVQEPVPLTSIPDAEAQHIAPHVMTEDHIPPALEASVEAITSENLDPDEVEIVTSSAHQPAATHVLEASSSHADLHALHSGFHSPFASANNTGGEMAEQQHQQRTESIPVAPLSAVPQDLQDELAGSNYGSLDPNDVRRLSFISFADVVQSEHQHPPGSSLSNEAGSRDSLHIANLPSPGGALEHAQPQGQAARTASPFRAPRSPMSSHSQSFGSASGLTTPPPGPTVNVNVPRDHYEQSPVRSLGGGDLNIETMRQAVRKTASGDLSGHAGRGSVPAMSPISTDEASFREARSRTNS